MPGGTPFFVGQIGSGEIYNQSPTECLIRGTRRWTTPGQAEEVEARFRELIGDHAKRTDAEIELSYSVQGDAFRIASGDPAIEALQSAHETVTGKTPPAGPKAVPRRRQLVLFARRRTRFDART